MKNKSIIIQTDLSKIIYYEAVVLDTIIESGDTKYLVRLISEYETSSERRILNSVRKNSVSLIKPSQVFSILSGSNS